jgi:hypothetical protein
MELIKVGILPLHDAKELQRILLSRNIPVELNHNGQTCSRGCTVTVELLAPREALAQVQSTLREQHQKLAEGHKVDWDLLEATFDPAKSQATCPACGTQFSTTSTECPDCGLCF